MQHLFVSSLMLVAVSMAAAEPVIIQCPAEPPQVRRLQLQERWRIDPDDEDAPLLSWFDQRHLATDGQHLYMLDAQLCQVLIFDGDGRHLDTIMGEGDGPGEVRGPASLALLSSGDLAVVHGYPSRLEIVTPDGTPRQRWQLGCNAWVGTIHETPLGWFIRYHESRESGDPGTYVSVEHVAYHDDDGQRSIVLHEDSHERRHGADATRDEADEYSLWNAVIPVQAGGVVRAPNRDEYRLEWFSPQGDLLRVVTRPFTAHRRTDDEMNEHRHSSYSIVNDEVIFHERELCDHDAMIRFLRELPDGSLRVRTSLFNKDLPDGMVCRYEVHEAAGQLRERVEIMDPTGTFDHRYDALGLLDDGRAVILRNLLAAFRATYDARTHPDLLAVLPPAPDDRADVAFVPIVCDLVAAP